MSIDTLDVAAVLRDLEQAEAEQVRLVDISRRLGWDKALQSRAVAEGLFEVERSPDRGHPYMITRGDAMTLLLAALLAASAGVAVVSMLRGLKAQGVSGPLAAEVLRAIVQK